MLKCLPTRPRRLLATEAETNSFSVETEAKTKTFTLDAEARPRRLKFQPKRDDLAEALLRLEMASTPRRQDRGHIPATHTPTPIQSRCSPYSLPPLSLRRPE